MVLFFWSLSRCVIDTYRANTRPFFGTSSLKGTHVSDGGRGRVHLLQRLSYAVRDVDADGDSMIKYVIDNKYSTVPVIVDPRKMLRLWSIFWSLYLNQYRVLDMIGNKSNFCRISSMACFWRIWACDILLEFLHGDGRSSFRSWHNSLSDLVTAAFTNW